MTIDTRRPPHNESKSDTHIKRQSLLDMLSSLNTFDENETKRNIDNQIVQLGLDNSDIESVTGSLFDLINKDYQKRKRVAQSKGETADGKWDQSDPRVRVWKFIREYVSERITPGDFTKKEPTLSVVPPPDDKHDTGDSDTTAEYTPPEPSLPPPDEGRQKISSIDLDYFETPHAQIASVDLDDIPKPKVGNRIPNDNVGYIPRNRLAEEEDNIKARNGQKISTLHPNSWISRTNDELGSENEDEVSPIVDAKTVSPPPKKSGPFSRFFRRAGLVLGLTAVAIGLSRDNAPSQQQPVPETPTMLDTDRKQAHETQEINASPEVWKMASVPFSKMVVGEIGTLLLDIAKKGNTVVSLTSESLRPLMDGLEQHLKNALLRQTPETRGDVQNVVAEVVHNTLVSPPKRIGRPSNKDIKIHQPWLENLQAQDQIKAELAEIRHALTNILDTSNRFDVFYGYVDKLSQFENLKNRGLENSDEGRHIQAGIQLDKSLLDAYASFPNLQFP